MLCSKIQVSFADHHCFPRFLMSYLWINGTVMASFQYEECVGLAIAPITQPTSSLIIANQRLSHLASKLATDLAHVHVVMWCIT